MQVGVQLAEAHRVLREFRRGATALPLGVEELLEARLVHADARGGHELPGHLHREAERVVEPECRLTVDLRPAGILGRGDGGRQLLHAAGQGALELLLLGADGQGDPLARGRELVVVLLHRLHDLTRDLGDRARLQVESPGVEGGAPDQPAQDVAAPFVGRGDAVGDEERGRSGVLGDDPHRNVLRLVRAVRRPGQGLEPPHERPEEIGLERVGHALQHLRGTFEPGAGIDVPLRQRHERAVLPVVVRLEDEVPDLEVPPAVLARVALVRPGPLLRAAVHEDLTAWATEPRGTRGPEVRVVPFRQVAEPEDLLRWQQAKLLGPDVEGLVVVEVDRRDERPRIDLEPRREELPAPGDGLLLPVVADAEVAQHLEERVVVRVGADDVEVGGAEALLHRDEAFGGRLLRAEEVRHDGLHPRAGEEDARVVLQDQRRAGQPVMPLLFEELRRPPFRVTKNAGHGRGPAPAFPVKRIRRLAGFGAGPSGRAAAGAAAGAVPLALRVVEDLAALHRDLVRDPLRDALQVVRAPLQLIGAELKVLARVIAGFRRIQERRDRTDQETDHESHLSFTP